LDTSFSCLIRGAKIVLYLFPPIEELFSAPLPSGIWGTGWFFPREAPHIDRTLPLGDKRSVGAGTPDGTCPPHIPIDALGVGLEFSFVVEVSDLSGDREAD